MTDRTDSIQMWLLTSPDNPFGRGPRTFRAGFSCLRCALPSSELRNDPVQNDFVARPPKAECATAGFSGG